MRKAQTEVKSEGTNHKRVEQGVQLSSDPHRLTPEVDPHFPLPYASPSQSLKPGQWTQNPLSPEVPHVRVEQPAADHLCLVFVQTLSESGTLTRPVLHQPLV